MGLKEFFQVFSVKNSQGIEVSYSLLIFLTIVYIGTIVAGYFLMSSQVKIVKKEIWSYKDTLKCIVFAFFFGSGITIIITMMATFVLNNTVNGPNQGQAFFIFIPMFFCLIFITLYPLLEFLFMAHSANDLSVTPTQKLFENLIKKFKKPTSYIIALLLYIFCIPTPILIMVLSGVELVVAWISWALLFPMSMIVYYASLGFSVGHALYYSHIAHLERSTFLHFDNSNRALKEFWRNPFFYIIFFVLNYIYVYELYKSYSTLSHFSINYIEKAPLINFDWSIPIALVFAISAYFTRYWKRKVKVSAQSIFFSGFLIAAIGINVLINIFITYNGTRVFESMFKQWEFTSVLYEARIPGRAILNHSKLNLIGSIEEVGLFVIISFFFFIQKDHKLYNDALEGVVTAAADKFNPIPPFNMCRYKNSEQRKYANQILLTMYDRIPIKYGYNLTQDIFKDPLLDAMCDPSNIYAQQTGKLIFNQLLQNHPKKTLPIIYENIESSNFDKVQIILESLISHGENIIPFIKINKFYTLLTHPNYKLRKAALSFVNVYYRSSYADIKEIFPSSDQISQIIPLLEDADYEIEAESLEFLSHYSKDLDASIFASRLEHPVPKIRSIAASISSQITGDDLSSATIPKLIEMLESPNNDVKIAAMNALGKIGDFDSNKIPLQPFKTSLVDNNEKIRKAAVVGIVSYLKEKPLGIKPEYILRILSDSPSDIQESLLTILGYIWKQAPAKVFPVLITFLRNENTKIKKISQQTLVAMGYQDPKTVTLKLIVEQETESYIRRGKISDTIIQISAKYWKRVIPIIMTKLESPEEHIRLNCATVLNAISELHPEDIPADKFISLWINESSSKMKKEMSPCIGNISSTAFEVIEANFSQIKNTFVKSNSTVKLAIVKMYIILAQKSPSLIKFDLIKDLTKDKDPNIRELSMELIEIMGSVDPQKSIKFLMKGLNDPEWPVKNAAADSIAHFGEKVENETVINEIKKMLYDKEKWTRLKGLEVITSITEKRNTVLTIDEILALNSSSDDVNFRKGFAKLLGLTAVQDFDKFFPEILKLLQDTDESVRKGMISGVVSLSSKIEVNLLVPKLLFYLTEETPLVLQQSIALALKRIVKYEKKELKDRVIALLKKRALVSQDEIISSVLSDLKY
ncbi:hypothetical protein [Candidatus Lokiarchaeum ossiferum]|uniref:hypothetical protein n=1 Tax=Candidatus Lokiarchaeum ossiferum TaxID=2951803 RepID=UPI00352D538A